MPNKKVITIIIIVVVVIVGLLLLFGGGRYGSPARTLKTMVRAMEKGNVDVSMYVS